MEEAGVPDQRTRSRGGGIFGEDSEGAKGPGVVKNRLPEQKTQEVGVRSLGQEDPLEQEILTHCGIPVWETPQTESPKSLTRLSTVKE